MTLRPPRSTRTNTPVPSTTLFRSGGQATMSGEPYAPATGPGAGSAAIAMAQPELQVETAAGRVPEARAEEDSFIAPQPAEPEAEGGSEMGGFHAEPDPFAEAALANAARREAPRQERSEEHTSELQSLMRISYAVFCLKKKKKH